MLPVTMCFLIIVITLILLGICYILDERMNYYKSKFEGTKKESVVEEMFEIMSISKPALEKVKELNLLLINTYSLKYSTIAIYDGSGFEIMATNVEKEYIDSIQTIPREKEFKARKNISKYITSPRSNTLLYRSAIERNISSALYSPIYFNDMFIGFWLIEDTKDNAFEYFSKDLLYKLKNNIGFFLENLHGQSNLEVAENTDKQTGFYNNMYLYSNARQAITEFDTSCIIMICLSSIPYINERYNRNIGNALIIKCANIIRDTLSDNSIFIRYSGLRLVIIAKDTTAEAMQPVCEVILSRLKNQFEYMGEDKITVKSQMLLHTMKKQNNIEKEIQKMISYIDNMESTNTIKII